MKINYRNFMALLILVIFASACASEPVEPAEPVVTSATMIPQTPTVLSDADSSPTEIAESDPTETVEDGIDQDNPEIVRTNHMNIQIGNTLLTATLVDNSSTQALKEALAENPITIEMSDYGSMEKVGSLGLNLPRNDQQITTKAGDIILFQGNAFVIYYAPNSWNFTRLGSIDNVTEGELREILGDGNVTVTLSLP